ncbi:MAG: hypothetical protein VW337_08455 [Gammaproteobacteria bacterium]
MNNYITSLEYQGLLKVSGEDSEKFLQGQLTCDLENLPSHNWVLGAACNSRGRVYSSFRILRTDDTFFMALQMGILPITQNTLQKYIPFYKAEMQDASSEYKRFGLWGNEVRALLEESVGPLPKPGSAADFEKALILNLGGNLHRFEFWCPKIQNLPEGLTSQLQEKDSVLWRELDHDHGIFMIDEGDVEQYTPEEAGMDVANFVSFEKGCYTGQEIVARMHYKGKGLKRLHQVSFTSDTPLTSAILVNSEGKVLDTLTNIIHLDGNVQKAFATLKTSASVEEMLFVDDGSQTIPATVKAFV